MILLSMDNSDNNTKKALDEGKLPPVCTPSECRETTHPDDSSSNDEQPELATVFYCEMRVDDIFDLEQDTNDKRESVVTKIRKVKDIHKKKTHNLR